MATKKHKRKCPVCGLYVWGKPHSGAIHSRIRAARKRLRRR